MSDSPNWLDLIHHQRWAALGTIDDEGLPYVSSVAYGPISNPEAGLLINLSQMAAHTGYLQSRSTCSLLIGEPDHGIDDPQTLARLTLVGETTQIPRDSETFKTLAKQYINHFPNSEMRFGLGDFHLFHFIPQKGNFVGGFGAAGKLTGEQILKALEA